MGGPPRPDIRQMMTQIAELRGNRAKSRDYAQYHDDPCGYADDVLKVSWWGKQQEVARALLEPPYRVLVKASHSVGKTHLAGGLVNWWTDTRPNSIVLTTAPTERQVNDLTWKEVRVQRRGRPGFRGPQMPRIEFAPDWYAAGITARNSESFQGHHAEKMLFIFDEAVAVDSIFWEAAESMFGGEGHAWLAIFNPTDQSSQAAIEDRKGTWRTITMSSLDHPNVVAELKGEPPPYPGAIRLGRLMDLVEAWCVEVRKEDVEPGDFELQGKWWRPGPVAEARLLGRWPRHATNSVWSEALFTEAETRIIPLQPTWVPEIGCDVARYGDDFTTVHARAGCVSLSHEAYNGLSGPQVVGKLKFRANELGKEFNCDPKKIPIKVDADGMGGMGVVDWGGEFNFIGVSAAEAAHDQDGYPNRRSELWFALAEIARRGLLSLARLPKNVRDELKRQAMSPKYKLDKHGRRVVESKDETKAEIKRSPDDMDGMNLAYYVPPVRRSGPKRISA